MFQSRRRTKGISFNRARTYSYARSSPQTAKVFSCLGMLVMVLVHFVPSHYNANDYAIMSTVSREVLEQKKKEPTTIAYAISLIKCGDGKQNAADGLTEAALVLRHAIRHLSVRNPQSGSRYDYKLYALVHRQAEGCAQPLADAGYELKIVDPFLSIRTVAL